MKKIIFTVTTDLTYDQRMIRICTSLSTHYDILLVGRKSSKSVPLNTQPFRQKRFPCLFQKGKLFYTEYNIRLFFFLLFSKMNAVCAIDLDTIVPCYLISRLKCIPRIYDAHELFCEMKEVVTRKRTYWFWKKIERFTVPHFKYGYTVNQPISNEFRHMYQREYAVIRNLPFPVTDLPQPANERFVLYQGAVNEGRSFETLIPAMQWVKAPLIICGTGNFMEQAQLLVKKHGLEDKVIFKGAILPNELKAITQSAYAGVTLFENNGSSNYFSLANRFFDYIQAGIPQLCIQFPVYEEINKYYNVAVLTNDLSAEAIAKKLNNLLDDAVLYETLLQNCLKARRELNWTTEEKTLVTFYRNILD